MSTYHTPVLVDEVLRGLNVEKGKRYIDATVGGGGDAVEILKHGGLLLGIDADFEALETARVVVKAYTGWQLVQGNFRDLEVLARRKGFDQVDGVVFDLGVSSHQLDTPSRGFSYRFESAPLDLRFNQRTGITAQELIHGLSEGELYEIFQRFGEEELARPIARAIVRTRKLKPIQTTGELTAIIASIIPSQKERFRTLSRVFQALRITVNDEIPALRDGLCGAERLLGHGARLVVISFHSLEDRIVKQYMKQNGWHIITKKPIVPGAQERTTNIRARSAKLRVAEKL